MGRGRGGVGAEHLLNNKMWTKFYASSLVSCLKFLPPSQPFNLYQSKTQEKNITHTHTYTHTHAHTQACTHARTRTQARTHTRTHTRVHTHTHTHTYTHTHTHTHTHNTHTNTHTHTLTLKTCTLTLKKQESDKVNSMEVHKKSHFIKISLKMYQKYEYIHYFVKDNMLKQN